MSSIRRLSNLCFLMDGGSKGKLKLGNVYQANNANKPLSACRVFFSGLRTKAVERRDPVVLPRDTSLSVCYSEGAELASGGCSRAGRAPALTFSVDLDTENT